MDKLFNVTTARAVLAVIVGGLILDAIRRRRGND